MPSLASMIVKESDAYRANRAAHLALIEEFRALGYRDLTMSQLIELRDHGVTASYASRAGERMRTKPTIDELIDARDHGMRY